MLEKDLINLDNQELIELLATLEEMDVILQQQEELLKESSENNGDKF